MDTRGEQQWPRRDGAAARNPGRYDAGPHQDTAVLATSAPRGAEPYAPTRGVPGPGVGPRPAPDDAVRRSPGADHRAGTTRAAEQEFDLHLVLEHMLAVGASDLHLAAGSPPLARVDGRLGTFEGFEELSSNGIQQAVYEILTQKQRERFEADLELDLACSLPGRARFR